VTVLSLLMSRPFIACQQNIYRYILENYYNVPLKDCKLLRVHASISHFETVQVPDLQPQVALLFEELKHTTLKANLKHPLDLQVPPKHKEKKLSRVFLIILFVVRLSLYLKRKASKMALSLKNAVTQMNIVCQPQDEKKRAARKGKGSTHCLFSTHLGGLERVDIQMARTTTFGCRQSLNNAGGAGPPKYQARRCTFYTTFFLYWLET